MRERILQVLIIIKKNIIKRKMNMNTMEKIKMYFLQKSNMKN